MWSGFGELGGTPPPRIPRSTHQGNDSGSQNSPIEKFDPAPTQSHSGNLKMMAINRD